MMTRLILRTRPFIYGLVIGALSIVVANSLGHVILVEVTPSANQVIMGAIDDAR